MAAAPPDGQEKVIAAAQHIVKSLANSKNAADDMIRILSGFDNRFSHMTDLFPPANPNASSLPSSVAEGHDDDDRERPLGPGPDDDDLDQERDAAVEDAMRVIEQWDSPAAGDRLVFESSEDAEEYLAAAACLVGEAGPRVESALQVAMARLEELIVFLSDADKM